MRMKWGALLCSSPVSEFSSDGRYQFPSKWASAAQLAPPELLLQVFSHLSYDKRTLAACALVCRSWSPPSSVFLLRSVSISTTKQNFAFKRPPSMMQSFASYIFRSSRLAGNITQLSISSRVDFLLLQSVLLHTTSLKILNLHSILFYPLGNRPRFPQRPCLNLQKLTVQPGFSTKLPERTTPAPFDVLTWAESVEHLSLSRTGSQVPVNLLKIHRGSKVFVKKLTIDGNLLRRHLPVLRHVLEFSSIASLQLTSLEIPDISPYGAFLLSHCRGLETCYFNVTAGPLGMWFSTTGHVEDLDEVPAVTQTMFSFSGCPDLHTITFSYLIHIDDTNAAQLAALWKHIFKGITQAPGLKDLYLTLECEVYIAPEQADPVLAFLRMLNWHLLDERSDVQVHIKIETCECFPGCPPMKTPLSYSTLIQSKVDYTTRRALTFL